ncbi:hypothetical protein GCM10009746_30630 [Microbacterium paludicola]
MGMDVYGKAPTSEKGEYFRNSVWYWHPLAEYIQAAHPALAEPCQHWHTNDGDGLDAEQARALGEALRTDIHKGTVAAYASAYAARIESIPREGCRYCEGTGTRRDEVGQQMGMVERGWCNACDGVGTCAPPEAHYPFDEANVAAFARFAIASGGFEIW